jgi:hypothetical protein
MVMSGNRGCPLVVVVSIAIRFFPSVGGRRGPSLRQKSALFFSVL